MPSDVPSRQPSDAPSGVPSKVPAPFVEQVDIVLQGRTTLMNDDEVTAFLAVTQAILDDDTAVVSLVSQQLSPVRRRLAESGGALQVRTQVESWQDETPARTATAAIVRDPEGYVQRLQEENAQAFETVQGIEAVMADPEQSSEKERGGASESNSKSRWYVWFLLSMLVVAAVGFAFWYQRRLKSLEDNDLVEEKVYEYEEEEEVIGDDDDCEEISVDSSELGPPGRDFSIMSSPPSHYSY